MEIEVAASNRAFTVYSYVLRIPKVSRLKVATWDENFFGQSLEDLDTMAPIRIIHGFSIFVFPRIFINKTVSGPSAIKMIADIHEKSVKGSK